MKTMITALAITLTTATLCGAQTLRPSLDNQSAETIVAGCRAYAEQTGLFVSIAVIDSGGDLNVFSRMDGAHFGSIRISQWKGRTAASFRGADTATVAQWSQTNPGLAFAPDVATLEGGIPIFTEGGLQIGGVGVSGASAAQDADCARAGIKAADLFHE